MESFWLPIDTCPRDGTPFIALVTPLRPNNPAKGIHILHFRGKTFRYHHTPSRIFEAQKFVKWWMPIPEIPENLFTHEAQNYDPKLTTKIIHSEEVI